MKDESDAKPPIAEVRTAHAHRLFIGGLIASGMYVGGLLIYALFVWDAMLGMSPDELATFLSGVFAPLAFLWLVLGFRQQGDELQNSARALWLQGEELRNSVEQQRQLVEVSREQLASEAAGYQRAEDEADRAAQPRLVIPSIGGTWSGDGSQNLRLAVTSAGPICSEVVVRFNDSIVARRPVFAEGERIEFRQEYHSPEHVESAIVTVEYTDRRSNRRSQSFSIPVDETGGVGGRRTLGEPVPLGVQKPPSTPLEGDD